MPVIEELNDTFYRQELNSFLNSFVTTQDAIDTGQAPPTAPTSAQQVLKDIQELWKNGENPPLHPADLREALAQKYMPDADPKLLEIYSDVERSRYEPDKMTGFMQKPHLGLTSGLGHLYSQSTGRDVAMIEVDFSNMGGTNELYRALEAEAKGIPVEDVPVESVWKYTDDSAKLIAKTMQAELQHILPEGATLMPVRSGGDELRIIATGIEPDQYETISKHIHSKIETHMAALDLHDHEHLKAPGNDVKNGFGAAFTIVDMNALDPAHAVELADEAIKAKKIELGHNRLGSIDEAEIREIFTEFFNENPDKIPDGMTKDTAVDFLVENEKAHSQAKNAEFAALKQTTSDGPKAKADYIKQEIQALDIDEAKAIGLVKPDYLEKSAAGDSLFAPPAEQRAQAVENRITNNGVKVANDYEVSYLQQLTQSTTARDPSADAWMPNDLPETTEIYARDTERLKAQMLLEGADISPEQINSMKPQMMGVSFHNLGGLNDAVGHDGANAILKHMSKDIIGEALKQEGIMTGDYQIAHYGGAEFQILVKPAIGGDGDYKIIDEDVIQRVQNSVEMRTQIMESTNIVDFLTEKGMPPTAETQAALGDKTFANISDVKPDRNISGIFAVTNSTPLEFSPGQDRAGGIIYEHRQELDNDVDAQRAKIIQENGIQPRETAQKSIVPELDEFKQKLADYQPTSPQNQQVFLGDMAIQLDALYDEVLDREDMDPELQDKALKQIHDEAQKLPAERNKVLQGNVENLPEDQQRRLGLTEAAQDSAHFTVKYGNHRAAVSLIMYSRGELTGDEVIGKITDFSGERRDLTVAELAKTFEDGTLHSSNSNSKGVAYINYNKVNKIVDNFDLKKFFDPARDNGDGIVVGLQEVEANTTLPRYADAVDIYTENIKFSNFLYEQTYNADAPDQVPFAKNVTPESIQYSVANEVQTEINRVFAEHPNAIETLGGKEVLQQTQNSISELDTKFENRSEFLLHTGKDSFETAEEFTRLHVKDYRENGRPSLVTQALEFAEEIGLDRDSPEYKAMVMVATRAEVANSNLPEYHSKNHYTDVTAITGSILLKNNELSDAGIDGAIKYTPKEQALAFISAIGHDLDHPGGKNPPNDPLMFERAAFEKMEPLLKEAGLNNDSVNKINTIITTTSPDGPHNIIKEVARAHRDGDAVRWEGVDPNNKFPQLRELENDPKLTQLASSLSDADLYASGGAGLKANAAMSELFTIEDRKAGADVDYRTDQARMGFFEYVIGDDGFTSVAGREIANETHMQMRQQTAVNLREAAARKAELTIDQGDRRFAEVRKEAIELAKANPGEDITITGRGGLVVEGITDKTQPDDINHAQRTARDNPDKTSTINHERPLKYNGNGRIHNTAEQIQGAIDLAEETGRTVTLGINNSTIEGITANTPADKVLLAMEHQEYTGVFQDRLDENGNIVKRLTADNFEHLPEGTQKAIIDKWGATTGSHLDFDAQVNAVKRVLNSDPDSPRAETVKITLESSAREVLGHDFHETLNAADATHKRIARIPNPTPEAFERLPEDAQKAILSDWGMMTGVPHDQQVERIKTTLSTKVESPNKSNLEKAFHNELLHNPEALDEYEANVAKDPPAAKTDIEPEDVTAKNIETEAPKTTFHIPDEFAIDDGTTPMTEAESDAFGRFLGGSDDDIDPEIKAKMEKDGLTAQDIRNQVFGSELEVTTEQSDRLRNSIMDRIRNTDTSPSDGTNQQPNPDADAKIREMVKKNLPSKEEIEKELSKSGQEPNPNFNTETVLRESGLSEEEIQKELAGLEQEPFDGTQVDAPDEENAALLAEQEEAKVEDTTPEPKPEGAEPPPEVKDTEAPEKTAQTDAPDVPSGGKINAGMSSAGVAMAGIGLKNALETGDTAGATISGIDLTVSTADLVMDGASAFGKTIAPAMQGIAQKANIGVMIADGVWQISREEGLDNKAARGGAVTLTTGTAMGVGSMAAAVTTTGAAATVITVAAPVAAAVTVGIATDKAVEAYKVTEELEDMFERNEQAVKSRNEVEESGAPKLQNYKNLNVYAIKEGKMPDGSNPDDLSFREKAKIVRGHEYSSDEDALDDLEEKLKAKVDHYDKIIEENESWVHDSVRFFWADDKIDKVRDARIEGAHYKAAYAELKQYREELETHKTKQELTAKNEQQTPEQPEAVQKEPEKVATAETEQPRPERTWEQHFDPKMLAETKGASEEFNEAAKPEQEPKPAPELVAERETDPSVNSPGMV